MRHCRGRRVCRFIRIFRKAFNLLIMPLKAVMPEGDQLIFTNLPEMFFTYLKVAFLSGVLLMAPVIFYQLWMFIAPGLYRREKNM